MRPNKVRLSLYNAYAYVLFGSLIRSPRRSGVAGSGMSWGLLGGSWDLVSKVTSTLIAAIPNEKMSNSIYHESPLRNSRSISGLGAYISKHFRFRV